MDALKCELKRDDIIISEITHQHTSSGFVERRSRCRTGRNTVSVKRRSLSLSSFASGFVRCQRVLQFDNVERNPWNVKRRSWTVIYELVRDHNCRVTFVVVLLLLCGCSCSCDCRYYWTRRFPFDRSRLVTGNRSLCLKPSRAIAATSLRKPPSQIRRILLISKYSFYSPNILKNSLKLIIWSVVSVQRI